jgi:regulator of RNase E activity RraA
MVPIPGKTRIKVLSINDPIICAGVRVRKGDVIVADGTGVLCIPIERLKEVTEASEKFSADDKKAMGEMENGLTFTNALKKFAKI